VRLALRRDRRPETFRPAERYLVAAAGEARGLRHPFVGTEHLLLAMLHDAGGDAAPILERLGAPREALERALAERLPGGAPAIDADALATLGIDFDAVRERLDETFGDGALERTQAGCMSVSPWTKRALARAVELADGRQVTDRDVLEGLLFVRDSPAAQVLARFGIRELG
jgi:ATP-dependent Clp protease ATP-binding subunit ClpA